MDVCHLTVGTELFFPVRNEGALFSCGDCHSAQGDREVCVTGIESPMLVKLRFNVIKNMKIPSASVHYEEGSLTRKYESLGHYATTGIALDLIEIAKSAVRNMIVHLTSHIKAQPN